MVLDRNVLKSPRIVTDIGTVRTVEMKVIAVSTVMIYHKNEAEPNLESNCIPKSRTIQTVNDVAFFFIKLSVVN